MLGGVGPQGLAKFSVIENVFTALRNRPHKKIAVGRTRKLSRPLRK